MLKLRKRNLKREIVISRYNESLDWLDQVPDSINSITVYNKGLPLDINNKRTRIVNLPNVGREGHTWLYHWTMHRESLADLTFTLQGNPFDHSPDLMKLLTFDFDQPSTLTRYYTETWPGKKVTSFDKVVSVNEIELRYGNIAFYGYYAKSINQLRFDKVWNKLFIPKSPFPDYYYGYGAMWAVPKQTILSRPLSFYSGLLEILTHYGNPKQFRTELDAWDLEMLWTAIYESPAIYPSRLL